MADEKKPRLFYDRGDVCELIAESPEALDGVQHWLQHLKDFMECGHEGETATLVLKFKTDAEVEALPDL